MAAGYTRDMFMFLVYFASIMANPERASTTSVAMSTNYTRQVVGDMADNGFLKTKPGFATIAIHAGQEPEKWKSLAVIPPIVTATTFKLNGTGESQGYEYARVNNPTRNTLEECIAALEDGKHAMAFASGTGAITAVAALLSAGDHIVCTEHVYSGTMGLLRKVISRMNISTTFTDFTNVDNVSNAIQENTKLVWIETPTNPTLIVEDIEKISKIAKDRGNIIVAVDNTFLSPYLQRPLDFGADISVYSLTKYMNGHSDVIMGAVVVNDDSLAKRLRTLQITMGAVPSPMDCYLVNRGLKTLFLRMERHKESSLIIAKWLLERPEVTEVYHPALPSNPQYELSKKQTSGHSGVFSFKHCGHLKQSNKFLNKLKIFTLAGSLGGYESLAELPYTMSHDSVSPEEKERLGITQSLIRLSIGLEDTEHLIEDLKQAFEYTFSK